MGAIVPRAQGPLKIAKPCLFSIFQPINLLPYTISRPCEKVLLAQSLGLQLKGTVLLAQEGINLFLAGPAPAVRDFVAQLQQDPRFADLAPKESWSATQPFKKLLVKVKREIIRMDHPAIRPAQGRAPAVSPDMLKRWLDAGMDDDGPARGAARHPQRFRGGRGHV